MSLVDTLRAKKQELGLPPSQNLLRAGHVPVGCISFQAHTMAAAAPLVRMCAPSQLVVVRRDALSLTVSAPRLSDLLSNSRSGDAADQQVVCVCTPCSAAWSAVAILFVSRLADGDDNVVRWLRASALRPRHTIFGRGADEQRTVTVVMAAAPCHPCGVAGGCEVCLGST